MVSDTVRAGSILGIVRSSVQVSIGSLVGGNIDRGLLIGRTGTGLVFVVLASMVSLWQRGLAMFIYGIFLR